MRNFWACAIACACIVSLVQDARGAAPFDARLSGPLAIVGLAVAVFLLLKPDRQDR